MSTRTVRAVRLMGALVLALAGCGVAGTEQNNELLQGARGAGAARSADGALAARALINADGTADFEASTGDLDSPTPPERTLASLSLRAYDNGVVAQSWDRPNLTSGFFSERLTGFTNNQAFSVDALIRSADPGQPVSARVQGVARLRPDLRFAPLRPTQVLPRNDGSGNGQAVSFDIIGPEIPIIPPFVPINVPIIIGATIYEYNNAVGATTNCVFSVGGVQVGQVNAVTVAAGGSASCQVTHTFSTAGTKQVSLSLVSTTPTVFYPGANTIWNTTTIIGPEIHGQP